MSVVDDDGQDGTIQDDGDEEHQHHGNLHTGNRKINLLPRNGLC